MMSVLVTEEHIDKIDSTLNLLKIFTDDSIDLDDTFLPFKVDLPGDLSDTVPALIEWLSDIKFILTFKPNNNYELDLAV